MWTHFGQMCYGLLCVVDWCKAILFAVGIESSALIISHIPFLWTVLEYFCIKTKAPSLFHNALWCIINGVCVNSEKALLSLQTLGQPFQFIKHSHLIQMCKCLQARKSLYCFTFVQSKVISHYLFVCIKLMLYEVEHWQVGKCNLCNFSSLFSVLNLQF